MEDIKITSIKFRYNINVKGRKKSGSANVKTNAIICEVFYEKSDMKGQEEPFKLNIYAGIKGKLIEINSKLEENPNLLLEKPLTEGFVAIIDTRVGHSNVEFKFEKLLSEDEFKKIRSNLNQ
jgi:hypothetical protein